MDVKWSGVVKDVANDWIDAGKRPTLVDAEGLCCSP